jgi:hypothetical protein
MTGSGLGNFGLGNVGIYGQQPWQEEARRRVYTESFGRGLSMQGASMGSASPMQKLAAQNYASSFLPRSATIGGGMLSGNFMPSAGMNVPKGVGGGAAEPWWKQNQTFSFPY